MIGPVKDRLPWWLKIGIKLVLSRLPVPYRKWRMLGVFQHGFMLEATYAYDVFCKHYSQAQPFLPDGYSVLELGPGDSVATGIIASAHGASRTWLVDSAPFASMDPRHYLPLLNLLGGQFEGLRFRQIAEVLALTNTTYLTNGLESLKTIPDDSVDLIFSQAVLEHIALPQFIETIRELHRLQRPGGISSHRVDLQDHLAHSLNSLRFPRSVWESDLFTRSGFYTNRLRASQIVDTFEKVGYNILQHQEEKWPALPLRRSQLSSDYAGFSEEDLLASGLVLIMRK